MTSRGQRRTVALGVAALLAVIAGSVMAPELLAAPREKTDFIIITDVNGGLFLRAGTWKARGALTDSGGRVWDRDSELELLSPDPDEYGQSWMIIQLDEYAQTFEIGEATGVYAHLQGATGTYTSHWVMRYNDMNTVWEAKGGHKLTGTIPQ